MLDRIEYFESFATPGWDAPGAWWFDTKYEISPDVVNVNDSGCTNCGENAYWQTNITGSPYSVEVSLTYEPYSFGWAGVVFGLDFNDNSWWGCLFYRTATARELGLWRYPGNGSTQISPMAETADVEQPGTDPEVVRWIRAYREGNTILCEFINENGDVARTQPVQAGGQVDGLAGLRVYGAHAHFRSFTVYK